MSAAAQSHEDVSARLETCLNEERTKSKEEKQQLISQITSLINASAETQKARWTSQIDSVKHDIATSRSALQTSSQQYDEGMDSWTKKEVSFVDNVLESRKTIQKKMKEDWKFIKEHNSAIQSTTKSVHEETIRIVDAQMKDMAQQMQALDHFVTRARSQNERHHGSHISSLQGLASNVRQSYSSIGDHFVTTYDRVRDTGTDISDRSSAIQSTLSTLNSTVKQPLSQLRTEISEAPLQEYVPTGQTPRRVQYIYPTTLPHTEPHHKLLNHSAPPPLVENKSPSKTLIYTDVPSSDSPTDNPPSTSPSKNNDNNTTSLREISHNVVGLNRNHSDSAALPTLKDSGEKNGFEGGVSVSSMPPLKRQATMGDSMLPMKWRGVGGVVREKENLGASFGRAEGGRRLRSREAES